MMGSLYVVLLLCAVSTVILGYPNGAPDSACVTLTPEHTGISEQTSDSPYSIEIVGGPTSFTNGTPVKVKIAGGVKYGGFILQLRKKGEETPLGTWSAEPAGTKLLTCTTEGSTMTHTSSSKKETTLEYTWNPPASANGDYEFVATVANSKTRYWLGIVSDTLTANYGGSDNDNDGDSDSSGDGSGCTTVFQGIATFSLVLVTVTSLLFTQIQK